MAAWRGLEQFAGQAAARSWRIAWRPAVARVPGSRGGRDAGRERDRRRPVALRGRQAVDRSGTRGAKDTHTPIGHAHGLMVLTLRGDRIAGLTGFADTSVFANFGLPKTLKEQTMAYDEKLAARVRALIGDRDDVIEKRMFGGLTFMIAGHMCCGVNGNELIVRLSRDDAEAALARPHARPMDFTGRPMRDFVTVRPEGLTGQGLRRWVEAAIAAVESRPPREAKVDPR